MNDFQHRQTAALAKSEHPQKKAHEAEPPNLWPLELSLKERAIHYLNQSAIHFRKAFQLLGAAAREAVYCLGKYGSAALRRALHGDPL